MVIALVPQVEPVDWTDLALTDIELDNPAAAAPPAEIYQPKLRDLPQGERPREQLRDYSPGHLSNAETWEAGRDRNERDDTVYFGQSGNFRGFLSAQEGYLTDGESGVTGVSRELIFEFPEEPRRGKKTITKRLNVPVDDRNCYPLDGAGATQTFTDGVVVTYDRNPVYTNGPEYAADCRRTIAAWGNTAVNWNIIPGSVGRDESSQWPRRSRQRAVNQNNLIANTDWAALSQTAATAYCQSQGYQRAVNVVATTPHPALGNSNNGWDNDYWVYQCFVPTPGPARRLQAPSRAHQLLVRHLRKESPRPPPLTSATTRLANPSPDPAETAPAVSAKTGITHQPQLVLKQP